MCHALESTVRGLVITDTLGSSISAQPQCLKVCYRGMMGYAGYAEGSQCRNCLLVAWQVASSVAAGQQHFRDGLCAGPTALIAQLAAGVAAGLQLMGAGLHALQCQVAGVIRVAHPARGAGVCSGTLYEMSNTNSGLV